MMAFIKIAAFAVLLVVAVIARPESQDDKASQPYEFEYAVSVGATPHSGGSSQQGHAEARVGDHSIGNYYVQLPEQGSASKVSYTTDLWGFHPVVSYSSNNKHSSSSTRFAYGDRAVAAISSPNAPGNLPVSIDSAAKVANFDVSETLHNIQAAGNPPIPGHLAKDIAKAQHNLAVAHGGKVAVAAHAPVVPVASYAPVPQVAPIAVATAAPIAHVSPVSYAPVAPVLAPAPQPILHHHVPVASPAPFYAQQNFDIVEHQRNVRPIVVAEFNSNNHILANQHVSASPGPVVVSTTPAPYVSYASPTPSPIVVSSPRPIVTQSGGYFASTLRPQAFAVTPQPAVVHEPHFVSSTPQPFVLSGADIHHHQKDVVLVDRPVPVEVTKFVEKQVPVEVTKYVDRPVEVTKFVDRPVQVTKFVDRPVEVTKYVDRPVQVTKFVDRPVEVTKYVDRPVHVTKYVDRPVEVTKFIDRPVEVTKFVDRPVQVTKFVDRPVQVVKHVPVEKPIYIPGPTVEKHVPVQVTKYVDRPVPQPLPYAVPHPVPYAQYVLNVPYQYGGQYGGQYGYGKAGGAFRNQGSYADAALKLDAWKAEQAHAIKSGFSGFRSEALLKSGYGYGASGYSGAGFTGAEFGGYANNGYRTESAEIKGFKVSKTLLPAADYLPPVGPTKVTLTVEPHVHKTEQGRKLCIEYGGFKPPLVPSRLLSEGNDHETW